MNELTTFDIELTAMAHGGAALGRHEGRVVFVPYALPGETARVEIVEDKGRFAFARVTEILTSSPDRIDSQCPHFGPAGCGGCQWQHIAYPAQLSYKAGIVTDQLRRIAQVENVLANSTLPDPSGWAYRNHVQFHPAPQGGLGLQAADGRGVVEVASCPIVHPLLAELYQALDFNLEGLQRLSLRGGTETGERMLVFEMRGDEPPTLEADIPLSCVLLLSDDTYVNLIGSNYIMEEVMDWAYRISAPSFFQVNTRQANRLVKEVLGYLELSGSETVLDAYCGVGLFTVQIAQKAGLVVAIESAHSAIEDLMENTQSIDNVDVIEGPVEAVLGNLDVPIDAAVVDPPRAGLDRFALDALADLQPERLVYVSCDPATLARDAKRLIRRGYSLEQVQPIDLFPQTYHIESVALFSA